MTVLIIGAGIIGASIADALARRGALVTVLDMRSAGRGASWASAGLLAPYIEAHGDTPLLQMGVRSLGMFDDFIARARADSGRAIDCARTGTLEVALNDADAERLLAAKAWLDTTGVDNEWIDAAHLRGFERTVSPDARGGLFIGTHGFVAVPSLVSALVQSARVHGAIFESPIEAVEVISRKDKADVEARAGDRRFHADHAIVAAGSWSNRVRVAGAPALPVRPVRGQLMHLRWTGHSPPARVVWGADCYTVPWSDGTLLVGATVEDVGFDESTTVSGVQSLTTVVSALLPDASRAALLEVRAGLRPATADGLPFIGSLESVPRVTFATGHYRNGILLAPLTAAMVTASVLDGRTDAMMTVTSPNRVASSQGGPA